METVEVVIRIPKKDYEDIECQMVDTNQEWRLKQAVRKGIVLQKGHDRLIDTHDLNLCIVARMININATDSIPLKDLNDCIKNETKTIVEANIEK